MTADEQYQSDEESSTEWTSDVPEQEEEPGWRSFSWRRHRAKSVHPLFDPTSYYRVASRDALSQDEGRQSVRDFFSAAALRALEEEWMYNSPTSPQDWGYPPAVNRAIHEAMVSTRVASQRESTRQGELDTFPRLDAIPIRAVVAPPAKLVVARVGGGDQPIAWATPQKAKDFLSWSPAGGRRGRLHLRVPDMPPAHHCLAVFLSGQLLERLGQVLVGCETEAPEAGVPGLLVKAFRPEVLSRSQHSPEAMDRAFRTSGILALAPALDSAIDLRGHFDMIIDVDNVELSESRPLLEPGTWLVVLVGPKDQEDG